MSGGFCQSIQIDLETLPSERVNDFETGDVRV
jgi:hypothetical protein